MGREVSGRFFFFWSFDLLGPHPEVYMEVLIRAVAASLCRATAVHDPSHIFGLHHSSWQHQILNSLSKVRD